MNQSITKNPKRWLILVSIILAHLPVIVNMTTLHVAVPTLTKVLNATGNEVLWIIDIYALVMAGLLVPMGTLADKIGAKKVMLIGLSIFFASSIFASLVTTAFMLIIARVFLAIGASFIMPSILSIVRNTFEDDKERGFALGIWGTITSVGGAVGPLVGGFLIENFWWGSVFLMNIPLLVIIIPMIYFLVPESKRNMKANWEIKQALILTIGLLSSIYALKAFFKPESNVINVIIILIIGISLIIWFCKKQLKEKNPMLDLALFKKPAISMGLMIALLVAGAFAGVELTIAQELQFVLDKTPFEAGKFMLPLMLASAIGGPCAGNLVSNFGLRKIATLSLAISAICLYVLGVLNFHSDGTLIILVFAILGFCLSLGLTSSSIAIMSSAPPEKAGAAGSIEGVGYELGMGLGITGFGLLISLSYRKAIIIPEHLKKMINAQDIYSIGDTIVASQRLNQFDISSLISAAKVAFSSAHKSVLFTSATIVLLVAIGVYVVLGKQNKKASSN